MSIPELFIKRPIMTTLVMAAILIFGMFAYRFLPVSDLPNVDFPTIQVNASLPGASPETMASSVATPLEKQFSTIAGIDSMTSTNSLGQTSITIQFNLSRSLDGAALDVQSAITQASGQLPPKHADAAFIPQGEPGRPADLVSGAELSDAEVVASRRSRGNHHGAAHFDGERRGPGAGLRCAEVCRPSAARSECAWPLARSALTMSAMRVNLGNTNVPTGTLWGNSKTFTILSNGKLQNAAQFSPMIVAYRNGAPVRISDIGRAIDSVQDDKSASWFNGNRAIVLAILRQPGTNTVEVVDNVKQLLPQLAAQIPAAVQINTLYDRSVSIRASVDDVKFTLMLTIGLVIMVIFLFLRNVSATVIPALALPMSIIGTFSVMYLLGYSLDNLSLMALTLSVGFVVDDAIVMLENIVRHMEMGKSPLQRRHRWLGRNRLHHSVHDAVAGGCVHPAVVHGRHHRAPAPRICGDHWRFDSRFRLRFAHPHADALQSLPEAHGEREARQVLQRERKSIRFLAEGL